MVTLNFALVLPLCGLCSLYYVKSTAGVTLSSCVNDGGSVPVAEVRNGSANTFTCSGLLASDTVDWRFVNDDVSIREVGAGRCAPRGTPGGCTVGVMGTEFTPSRRSDTESVMTIDTRLVADSSASKGSLICKTDSTESKCQLDLITVPQAACSVQFQSSTSWQTTGSCTNTLASSSRGRYRCTWYRKLLTSPEEYRTVTTYTANNKVCQFQEPLPAQEGQYSYRVKVTPGEVSVPASFGSNDNEIKRPVTPTDIRGCGGPNEYLPEFSQVTCTCSTTSVGKPQGRLLWRNTTSDVTIGSEGGASLEMRSSPLMRGDHVFTCSIAWITNIAGGSVTVKVGYKPERLVFNTGPNTPTNVTVKENDAVSMTCQAEATPTATMVLETLDASLRNSSLSPLLHTISRARCEDMGQYRCSASNTLGPADSNKTMFLVVNCRPRSTNTYLGSINFQNETVETPFPVTVTAYPAPTNFTFQYIGVNGTTSPSEPKNIGLTASCNLTSGVNQFTCKVLVLNVSSSEAAGNYTVSLWNQEGEQQYGFYVVYNGPVSVTTTSDPQSAINAAAVGGGVAGAVIGIAIIVIVVVVILRRKNGYRGTKKDARSDHKNEEQHVLRISPEQPLSFTPQAEQTVGVEYGVVMKQGRAPVTATPKESGKVVKVVKIVKNKPETKPKKSDKPKPNGKSEAPVYGNVALTKNKNPPRASPTQTEGEAVTNTDGLIYTKVYFDGTPSNTSPIPAVDTVIYSDIKVSVPPPENK